jgi:hypothetical protein
VLSDYLAAKLLEASVANVAFASGSPLYLAALRVPGDRSDTGTSLGPKEAVYGGYKRVAVPSVAWNKAVGPVQTNAEDIALAKWTSGPTAQVVAWALCDALTAGNVHHLGDTAALLIDAEDPEPSIGAGLLRLVFA